MELITDSLAYFQTHQDEFGEALRTHLLLSVLALLVAIGICVPLGILTSRWGVAARVIINAVGVARVVPSIAVLFLLLPYLGLGFAPALVALTLLACPPVLINTDAGMRGVDPAILEAGRGLGMGAGRLVREVQLPLALPVIIAGVRTSAVEVIASATLATLIGGGALGVFIIRGLDVNRPEILMVGAVPVALLAIATEAGLGLLQRKLSLSATETAGR
ncbi:MAG TPA: ABC transporter permease [Chloroflexia bacterium]|nr:ABC transporter permease [Chloroflexia bacterium]